MMAIMTKTKALKLWENSQGICCFCFCDLNRENITIEHIKPRGIGGRHKFSNLRLSCESCNNKKGKLDQIDMKNHPKRKIGRRYKGLGIRSRLIKEGKV